MLTPKVDEVRVRIGNSDNWPKAHTTQGNDSWLALYWDSVGGGSRECMYGIYVFPTTQRLLPFTSCSSQYSDTAISMFRSCLAIL